MARRPVHISKTVLSPRKRAALRASDFAVPSERKYPINDLFHARLALTYVLTPSNAAYRDEVVRAVMARYPELQFWWASRSKGVEAKRTTRKATSRRMPGQRMVANPEREDFPIDPFAMLFELERLEESAKTMSDADVRTALAESKKKLKSAADRLRRVQKGSDRRAVTEASQVRGHYAGMAFILETELAERGLRPFPRHDNPRPKTTSRRMPGQRMVANPRRSNPAADPTPMQRWSKKGVTVGLFDDFSGVLTVAAKTGDEDYLPVFRTKSYPAAVKYAEQYMSEVKTNPRPAKPASKRAGGRTAAQSNAAKAMKLFHSGQASSLAEAWEMVRREQTSRSRRDGYQMFTQTLLDADVLGHEPSRFWR